jgi:heme A synthase
MGLGTCTRRKKNKSAEDHVDLEKPVSKYVHTFFVHLQTGEATPRCSNKSFKVLGRVRGTGLPTIVGSNKKGEEGGGRNKRELHRYATVIHVFCVFVVFLVLCFFVVCYCNKASVK